MNLSNKNKRFAEILIVEDDPIIAKIQQKLLEPISESKITSFPNGKEAIDYLDERTSIEIEQEILVLLDLNMPVLNGWEFLEECQTRTYYKHLHVVIATSSTFREDYRKSEKFTQVFDYLIKPVTRRDLQELITIKVKQVI